MGELPAPPTQPIFSSGNGREASPPGCFTSSITQELLETLAKRCNFNKEASQITGKFRECTGQTHFLEWELLEKKSFSAGS